MKIPIYWEVNGDSNMLMSEIYSKLWQWNVPLRVLSLFFKNSYYIIFLIELLQKYYLDAKGKHRGDPIALDIKDSMLNDRHIEFSIYYILFGLSNIWRHCMTWFDVAIICNFSHCEYNVTLFHAWIKPTISQLPKM